MGRTVQGPTLGGDFAVTYVQEGELTTLLHLGIDAHPESAQIEAVIARQRFPGRKSPEFGDKLRVVIGLEPQDDAYDEPREAKVGVPVSLLREACALMPDTEVRRELARIILAVDDFVSDAQEE